MKLREVNLLLILAVFLNSAVARAERLNPNSQIFSHRGIPIRMMDLPDRKISCRMYIAERDRRGLDNLRTQFTGIKRLSRLQMTIQFLEDFSAADVHAQSFKYRFGGRMFRDTPMMPNPDSYEGLRAIDPDKSTDPLYGPMAKSYLESSEISDIVDVYNLNATLGDISPKSKEYDSEKYSYRGLHIFDRYSEPKFYTRITDHASPEEDEWGVSLWGEQKVLRPLLPPLFQSAVKDGLVVLALPVFPLVFLFKNSFVDQASTILTGGYCFPGEQQDLENYDLKVRDPRRNNKPMELKIRNKENKNENN